MIDRMADSIHCQMLLGKYGCAVTTIGSLGDADVLRYMSCFLNELGVVTAGKAGVAIGRNPEALDAAIIEAYNLGKYSRKRSRLSAGPLSKRKLSQSDANSSDSLSSLTEGTGRISTNIGWRGVGCDGLVVAQVRWVRAHAS
jgi:hypothetical protein